MEELWMIGPLAIAQTDDVKGKLPPVIVGLNIPT
jgi:hypothetical protein